MTIFWKVFVVALAITACKSDAHAQKSALDGHQFDGVTSDAALTVERQTRRSWLDRHPVEAKEYWAAWDCKGRPCDSAWYARIRSKAARIKRTDKDPKPREDGVAPPHRNGG